MSWRGGTLPAAALVALAACADPEHASALAACTYGPHATELTVTNRPYPEIDRAEAGTFTVASTLPLRLALDTVILEISPPPEASLFALGQDVEVLLSGVCTGDCQYYARLADLGTGAFLAAAWRGVAAPQGIAPGLTLTYEPAECPASAEACAEDVTPLLLTATSAADASTVRIGPQRRASFAGYEIVNGHSRRAGTLTCPNTRSLYHAGVVYPQLD